jgi:ketosteroid isomerase-like protein
MDLKELAEQYFEAFSRKDLGGLALMFHANVSLFDWEISAEGIQDVLAANKKIFDSVDTIKVVPMDLYQDGNVIVAELNIIINEKDIIAVADVLTFEDDKIIMVRAYKG